MKRASIIITLLTMMTLSIMAIPAKREAVKVVQPDGTTLTIRLHGDEWQHFTTTSDGYTVIKDKQGYYVYAQRQGDVLKATNMVAHDEQNRKGDEMAFLQSQQKYQAPKMSERTAQLRQTVHQRQQQTLKSRRAAQYDYTQFKGLIILVQYNDREFSRSDYKDIVTGMVNTENYTGYGNEHYTGSVRDYFSDNSGGKFQPAFDVVGPYTVDYSQYDAKGGYQSDEDEYDPYATYHIINAALDAADADVNFKDYDGDNDGAVDLVYFILAGNGANFTGNDKGLWWPHRSIIYDYKNNRFNYMYRDGVRLWDYASSVELAGYTTYPQTVKIDGIGTICHEFSHVLGLPDFYDTNYEEDGQSNDPGDWSVMSGGSYFNDSRTPVGYSLYERYSVGFCDEPQVITETGNYELEPLHANMQGYRLDTPVKKEFFLLENRQKNRFKWDAYLPGSGMLVHRVDLTNERVWYENTVNANPNHNYYELLRANGYRGSANASDAFPGTKQVRELTNSSSPANLLTWAGKHNQFGLFDIQMSNGIVKFKVDNYNLTALAIDGTLTLGVGMVKQLTPMPTPTNAEYTLTWKSSDETIATVDEQGWVKGIQTGTCTITATSNNGIEAECMVTIIEMPTYNISEFKQLYDGEKALLRLEDAQVLFTYTKNNQQTTYLRDQTGAIMLSDVAMAVKNNDIVNGVVYLQNTFKYDVPQGVTVDGETNTSGLIVTEGSEATPREVAFDDLTAADYNDLVVVKGVKIKRESGFWAYSDNTTARIWAGNLGVSTGLKSSTQLDGKFFNVTAIYGRNMLNNSIIQELNVTKAVEEGTDPTGIMQIANDVAAEADAPAYNMAGQRVGTGYKGLVIRNGKKVVNN